MDWKKLGEDFYNGQSHYRHTPPSSPPDIWWSSSGSSNDLNQTLPSLRCHKVITKLDFDSCVVQSPCSSHKSRAHVIRNVVRTDALHNSSVNVECKSNRIQQDLSVNVSQLFENVSVPVNDLKNENHPVIVSENLDVNDSIHTSPVIGTCNKNATLCENNILHDKKLKRKKRRKIYDKQTLSLSPVIGLYKSKIKSCILNSKIEGNLEESLSDHIQEDGIKSPVLKFNEQLNRKDSNNQKTECLEIKNDTNDNDVITEIYTGSDNTENIQEGLSPILGLSLEKKSKHKRRKLILKEIDKCLNENVKSDCDKKLVKVCKNLFSEDFKDVPEMVSHEMNLNNSNEVIESDIKSNREPKNEICNEHVHFQVVESFQNCKSEDMGTSNLKNVSAKSQAVISIEINNDIKDQKEENLKHVSPYAIGDFSSDIIESSFRIENISVEASAGNMEENKCRLNQNAGNCDKYDISINSPGTVCCRDSISVDTPLKDIETLSKSEYRDRADECAIEDIENDISVLKNQLDIEAVSSQEIIIGNYFQENNGDEVNSCEINVISSCSTPLSHKSGVLAVKNEAQEESIQLYMDSAKKKRLRLDKSGLAARLKKLISRKESSKHMMKHETNQMKHVHLLNKGITLTIVSVWKEYSFTLVYCTTSSGKFVSPQSSEVDGTESNQNFGLVVVLESVPNLKLKPHSTINIYPPWQVLSIFDLKLTMILGVSWIEEVQEIGNANEDIKLLFKPQQTVVQTVYSSSCECLQGKGDTSRCQFQFPRKGLEFLEFLLPLNVLRGVPCDSIKNENNLMSVEKCKWPVREPGIIAEGVANPGRLLTGDIWLQLCVLNVFCYRSRLNKTCSRNSIEEDCKVTWSVLGCDHAGECCEVVLGPGACEGDAVQIWSMITSRQAVGHFIIFTGFSIAKRFHKSKNPGFWALINRFSTLDEEMVKEDIESSVKEVDICAGNKHIEERNQFNMLKKVGECQLFIYVLAPGTEVWGMKLAENSKSVCLPRYNIHNLADALLEREGIVRRCTYLAKLIWATGSHLYVSDVSLNKGTTQNYMRIIISPSCVLPSEIVSNKAVVLLLQDLLLDNGVVTADKYSWVTNVLDAKQRTVAGWCLQIRDEDVDLVRNLQITPPHLTPLSGINDLVMLEGTVISVDEETAFSWPICGTCDNELLVEVTCNQYLCQKCGSSQTCTRMSLEVYVQCQHVPDTFKLKVKLQQNSIVKLLPASQDNNEGYELSSVLGQTVGPLLCVVVKTTACHLFLSEVTAW